MSRARPSADQARADLYDIMSDDLSFEEKANRALELGEAYLGVQNGHLTKIDERIDFWKAIASTDPPDGDFPPGEVLDLQTTYCRRTIEEGSSIALSDAPNKGWADDPAFEEHGLHCYHGTPLTINGEVFGTICFVSKEPREEPFSESETLFAELIARMLENELRQTRQATEVNLQSNLIGVLSRVLRHNLRNDLTIIRGHLKMIAEKSEEPLMLNEVAVSKVDKLVELANTARQIESIASSDLDRQPVELSVLLENVVDIVQSDYPIASFTIDCPDDTYVEAIPSLRMALVELIENAAKHTGDTPEITVAVEPSPDAIDIRIIDNGPGLPEQELEVLRKGSESPLIHGSGLGLWLTYWIVANHDGTINADVSDEGTAVTVTLPRTSSFAEFADSHTLLGRFYRQQDRFEAIFEESFDAIVLIDEDGRYTDVNESAADLFGLPQEELRGRAIGEFVSDDYDLEAAWSAFMASERERDTFPLQRADGTVRTVEYTAVTDIVPGQHFAILRDMTKRIEREEALQETTQQLQAVVEACPEPIIAMDTDGTVQLWNEAAEAVFGYPAEEVIGESIQTLDIHPENQFGIFEDRFQRALDGETFTGLEVRRRTKDGDIVHLSVSTAPLRDDEGEIDGLMAVCQDITDRVERERRFEALSEGFPDLCFIFDEDGVYRDVLTSPANEDILIGRPEELVGQAVTDVLPTEPGKRVRRNIERTIDTGEPQTFQYELQVPAGTRIFEGRTHLLSEMYDGNRLVSVVARDITELPSGEEVASGI